MRALHAAHWSVADAHGSDVLVRRAPMTAGLRGSPAGAARAHVPGGRGRGETNGEHRHRQQDDQRTAGRLQGGSQESFWKARGYDPKKPEITKQKLGYALDQEECVGSLVVRAMGLEPLFENYARVIGKRVNNMLTPLDAKLKALKKSGARGEPDRLALLQARAALNLDPPPPPSRKRPAPEPPPEPAPAPAASAPRLPSRCLSHCLSRHRRRPWSCLSP